MKKIFFIMSFFVIIILITSCNFYFLEDLRSRDFFSTNDFNYYPHKNKYNVGDTLWLQFCVPQKLKNEFFDVKFEDDTLKCDLNILINMITSSSDSTTLNSIYIDQYELFFKKGNRYQNGGRFYFVWDNESQKYINEFGFVLQDTGKFFIASSNSKGDCFYFFINEVSGLGKNNPHKSARASFTSTFQTTNKGWFEFEVVE
jgi:hypothetical protein